MTVVATIERPTALARPDADLGALTESEFEHALAKIETRKKRMDRILESHLVPNAHFGNPVTKGGTPVFAKPILYRAGADELAVTFGLQIIAEVDRPDTIVENSEYCSVTVRRAICDRAGRLIDRTVASCTTKEKRFKKTNGSGYTFEDAREALNDLHAMAEKRAKVRLVVTALGLGAWLAAEEEMEASLDATPDEKPLTPWTDEEKRQVYDAANAKGMGKKTFLALIQSTLGREKVGTGADVQQLLAAIAAWEKPTATTKADEPKPAPAPDPAPTASADVEYHETPKAPVADAAQVFGAGHAGAVLPGEVELAQAQAGELPLGDAAPRRTRNALREP